MGHCTSSKVWLNGNSQPTAFPGPSPLLDVVLPGMRISFICLFLKKPLVSLDACDEIEDHMLMF